MTRDLQVLLIDDNPEDRALVLRALRREFPDILTKEVSDNEDLEQALESFHYDLTITDYQLNWSTGLDILPVLKTRHPNCPVIMFTATGNEEIAVKAFKAGVDDYVLKSPRHFVQLAVAVRGALDRERNRKRAELSEARLQDLMSRLDVGVYRVTPKGKIAYANPAFLRIFGMRSWEEARNWDLSAYVANGEDLRRLRDELQKTGRVRIREMKLRGPHGEEMWISLSLTSLSGDSNVVEGLVEDVTELKRLDVALRAKEEELRQAQKLDSIGRLAGGVAHDFNNLLTAINGYSDLLLEMPAGDNPHRESLMEIRKAGTRAAALTRELLAFGRRQMLQPKALDLNELVLSMDEIIRRALGDKIEFVTHLSSNLGKVKADPGQVEIIIKNLIINAREAMPMGGRLSLATENTEMDGMPSAFSFGVAEDPGAAHDSGEFVCLAVEDTGAGMDQETLSRIFEPFFTTKPMGKGSGMGLATVYGIVKQSGGQILVSSEPGEGTRFRILLPAVPNLQEQSAISDSRPDPNSDT